MRGNLAGMSGHFIVCGFGRVGKDGDNVFITLSARRINPSITIVARSTSPETVAKLKIAGANRVISPSEIAGRRMAMGAQRPLAVDVFDTLSERSPHGQRIAEVVVTDDSPLCGCVVRDIHSEAGVHILAIAKRTGDLLVAPTEGEPIELGDAVMLVEPDEHLGKLEGKDA